MKLAAHGLSVEAPSGWEVRIARRRLVDAAAGEVPRPVLHASTRPLPADVADTGDGAFQRLSGSDVFLTMAEFEPEAVGRPLFAQQGRPVLSPSDFRPYGMQPSLPGQSGRQWFFTEGGRAFSLLVVLGSHARRAALVPQVAPVLASLSITPS